MAEEEAKRLTEQVQAALRQIDFSLLRAVSGAGRTAEEEAAIICITRCGGGLPPVIEAPPTGGTEES